MVPSKVTVPIELSVNSMVFFPGTARTTVELTNRIATTRINSFCIILSSSQKRSDDLAKKTSLF
jgi:hypothetical protein